MPEGLVNMKLSKKEAKDQFGPVSTGKEVERDRFPYGLSISLDEESLTKLGIDDLPDVGLEESMSAFVRVTSISDSKHEGDKKRNRSVSLQIVALRLGEGPKSSASKASSVLYGKGK